MRTSSSYSLANGVDGNELARIAGGPNYLHLIEFPYTFNQVNAFRDALVQELNELGLGGRRDRLDTVRASHRVRARNLDSLPQSFGSAVPDEVFRVVEGDIGGDE